MQKKNEVTQFLDWLGEPDYFIGLNPKLVGCDQTNIKSFLDDIYKMHLSSVFGRNWKSPRMRKKYYRMVLAPERESRNTKGNQYQLLHYHGYLWVDNSRLIESFHNGNYEEVVRRKLRQQFSEIDNAKDIDRFWIAKFDRSKKVPGLEYCTKNYGSDFNNGDTYVCGHFDTDRNK